MPKVLIVQPIANEGVKALIAAGYELLQLNNPGPEILAKEVVDVEAIQVRNAEIPRSVIEKGNRLKVISRHGAGLESIDVAAATEKGVYVTNTPVANSLSVAEHVLGMMLSLSKNCLVGDRELRSSGKNAFFPPDLPIL